MLKTHNRHTNITQTNTKRVSVMISDKINKNLDILAEHYEMPKKYVVKMLVEEKIQQVSYKKDMGVATR